jgi:hypothetical protein
MEVHSWFVHDYSLFATSNTPWREKPILNQFERLSKYYAFFLLLTFSFDVNWVLRMSTEHFGDSVLGVHSQTTDPADGSKFCSAKVSELLTST